MWVYIPYMEYMDIQMFQIFQQFQMGYEIILNPYPYPISWNTGLLKNGFSTSIIIPNKFITRFMNRFS